VLPIVSTNSQQRSRFPLAWAQRETDALSVCALAFGATIGWSIRAG